MQAWEFEQKVFDKEGVRIVIRAAYDVEVDMYEYDRCAKDSTTLTDWLNTRIRPLIRENEVMVVNGRGEIYPHGNTHMRSIRESYSASKVG